MSVCALAETHTSQTIPSLQAQFWKNYHVKLMWGLVNIKLYTALRMHTNVEVWQKLLFKFSNLWTNLYNNAIHTCPYYYSAELIST